MVLFLGRVCCKRDIEDYGRGSLVLTCSSGGRLVSEQVQRSRCRCLAAVGGPWSIAMTEATAGKSAACMALGQEAPSRARS